jgi:processive 1,2-diacylglycerol beta-glucosyltransferase
MKLLIISISAGAGHVRTAEALEKTAIQKYPNLEVVHIDMADYITLALKKTVIDSYGLMAKKLPELWGFLYNKTDDPKNSKRFVKLTKQLKNLNSLKLYEKIKEIKPDRIICTHFLPADVILNAFKRHQIDTPVSITITDYDLHNLWLVEGASNYFVATDKMAWKMASRGIKKSKIITSGIPIQPEFYDNKILNTKAITPLINPSLPTILVLSGGEGMGDCLKITRLLFENQKPINIISVAGNNYKLLSNMDKLQVPKHINLQPLGWVSQMDKLMKTADIIISKSGGITTSECIVLGKPMIIIDPIPGQEERNADFILANGYGQIARDKEDLLYYLNEFLTGTWKPQKKPTSRPAAEIVLEKIL